MHRHPLIKHDILQKIPPSRSLDLSSFSNLSPVKDVLMLASFHGGIIGVAEIFVDLGLGASLETVDIDRVRVVFDAFGSYDTLFHRAQAIFGNNYIIVGFFDHMVRGDENEFVGVGLDEDGNKVKGIMETTAKRQVM